MPGVILRDQDNDAVLLRISQLITRLSKLYQIPNWSAEASVDLAEWVIENYKFDRLEVVEKCLRNPPATGEKNFRLTPDTIQSWMQFTLNKEAENLERQMQKMKQRYAREATEFHLIEWKPSIMNTKKMIENFIEKIKPEEKPVNVIWSEVKSRGKYGKSIAKEYLEKKKK